MIKTISLIILMAMFPAFLVQHTGTKKAKAKNPIVIMKTSLGDITLELYPKNAPTTVANFERYIRENRFTGASFYRTVTLQNQPHNKVKIQVIQGGLFNDHDPKMLPPIPLETTEETGLHHLNGTISMARDDPNSATSEFFICIGDQPSLDFGGKRNPDGQGFAAFGRVIRGMDVVKKIQMQPAVGQQLQPHIKITKIILKN
ncbi:MAG: peptidylprolyl isomerase [Bacteroidales bacterium]|nr:peptidylprolyl isomerase [Bacteroidales bacterium]